MLPVQSICIFFPIYTFLRQYEPIIKHIDTMINYVLSFNDKSSDETTNKYQTTAYNYLKATGLTDSQLDQCIQKLKAK